MNENKEREPFNFDEALGGRINKNKKLWQII